MNTPFPPLRKPKSLRISTHNTNKLKKCPSDRYRYDLSYLSEGQHYLSYTARSYGPPACIITCFHLPASAAPSPWSSDARRGKNRSDQILWQINRQYDKGKEENQNAGIPFECRQRNKNSGIKLKNKVSQEIVKDDYPHNHGPS